MGTEQGQNRQITGAEQEAMLVLLGEIIVACNEPALSLLQTTREDLLGQSFLSFSEKEQPNGRLAADSLRLRTAAVLAGQQQHFEWLCRRANNARVLTAVTMDRIRARGKTFAQVYLRPVSEEEAAEDALLKFKLGIERSQDAIFMTDVNGKIIYANPAFEQVYGFTNLETLGHTPRILKSGMLSQKEYEQFWATLLNGDVVAGEIINKTKDGRLIQIEGSNNPILDEDGQLIGFLGIHRDISDRKESEQALQKAREDLEQRVSERTAELAEVNALLQDQNRELVATQDSLKRQNKILQTLNELTLLTASLLEPQAIYEKVMGFTGQLIDCTSATISTLDLDQQTAEVVAEYIDPGAVEAERISDLGTVYDLTSEFGTTPEALLAAEEVVIHQAEDETLPPQEKSHLERQGAKSSLVILIRDDEKPVAMIEYMDSRQRHEFSAEEIEIVKAVARQTAILIKNARLYQQTVHENREREALERHIQESFERRGRQVFLSAQLSKDILLAGDLTDLYQRVVNQVQEQFGFYHTQVLRYEPSLESVVLISGYGEIGQKMLDQNHQMPMGIGLIGTAAATGKSILRPDVTQDSAWKSNPLLPETKGELAVPIVLGDEVLGVLDVQSDTANALSTDDQLALEGLCGQIAIAIESTRLRQEMESRLLELNQLQRIMSREGWQAFLSQRDNRLKGYRFDRASVKQVEGEPLLSESDLMQAAWDTRPLASSDEKVHASPMTVRGQIIGALGIRDDPEHPLSSEDRDLLDSITVQVAEALESARLLEQTQKHALEMEAVAQVSAAASSILDTDRLLQTVTQLTKNRFDLHHVNVFFLEGEVLRYAAGTLLTKEMQASNTATEINLLHPHALLAQAARDRRPVVVNDVTKEANYTAYPQLPDTRSELVIPLIVGDQVLGVMDMQSVLVNRFTEDEIRIHTALGAQVAVALQNAQLYAEQLETAERLREVDRLKSEFLASMSHELRTPLNSIIGFADVLLEGIDGQLNNRMEEDITLIRESGRHLRALISEMLDMSKIEAGVMELHYEEIDLLTMAEEIIATARNLAKDRNLDIKLICPKNIGTIRADRTRLTQILLNLLSNAIKFTEEGHITLEMKKRKGDLLASVKDSGIGIKEEDIPKIFEQFRQIDGSLTRRAGGTGLGIPISKSLVELHGGEMRVESKPGVGSTFSFTIPGIQTVIEKKSTKTVLAIEDNLSNMSLIARVVESEGYDLLQAKDGISALELLAVELPDLILLDINIPGIHGLELAQRLKADERLAHIPVVATTANVLLGDRERCLEAGCDAYLPKPLDISELRQVMKEYLDSSQEHKNGTPPK